MVIPSCGNDLAGEAVRQFNGNYPAHIAISANDQDFPAHKSPFLQLEAQRLGYAVSVSELAPERI
jgi:hypothetical protein